MHMLLRMCTLKSYHDLKDTNIKQLQENCRNHLIHHSYLDKIKLSLIF